MSDPNKIEIGDTVQVNFNGAQTTLCKAAFVRGLPQATGDSWIFIDHETDQVHYVSEGCTITLLEKRELRGGIQ